LENAVDVGLPFQVWLNAIKNDEVALGRLMNIEVVLRPGDLAVGAFGVTDSRPELGEIVELFRLDLGERTCMPAVDEVLGGGRRGRARVGPTGKSCDQHWLVKLGLFEEVERGHVGGLLN